MTVRFPLLAALFLSLSVLAGCNTVNDVYMTEVGGRGFNHYLFDEYKTLASYESDKMYDAVDAEYFAQKAMKANAGDFVEPTLLSERKIDPQYLPEMAHARSELVNALLGLIDHKRDWADLAKAQASFDCWLEQQEENTRPEDTQSCRSAFYQAMDRVLGRFEVQKAFLVFFGHNGTAFDQKADNTISVVAQVMKDNPDLDAVLAGNTDTSGGESYNDRLGEKRADAVRKALIADGVAESRISLYSEGEHNLLVQTPDNVREQKNRRVDILIKMHEE